MGTSNASLEYALSGKKGPLVYHKHAFYTNGVHLQTESNRQVQDV